MGSVNVIRIVFKEKESGNVLGNIALHNYEKTNNGEKHISVDLVSNDIEVKLVQK